MEGSFARRGFITQFTAATRWRAKMNMACARGDKIAKRRYEQADPLSVAVNFDNALQRFVDAETQHDRPLGWIVSEAKSRSRAFLLRAALTRLRLAGFQQR